MECALTDVTVATCSTGLSQGLGSGLVTSLNGGRGLSTYSSVAPSLLYPADLPYGLPHSEVYHPQSLTSTTPVAYYVPQDMTLPMVSAPEPTVTMENRPMTAVVYSGQSTNPQNVLPMGMDTLSVVNHQQHHAEQSNCVQQTLVNSIHVPIEMPSERTVHQVQVTDQSVVTAASSPFHGSPMSASSQVITDQVICCPAAGEDQAAVKQREGAAERIRDDPSAPAPVVICAPAEGTTPNGFQRVGVGLTPGGSGGITTGCGSPAPLTMLNVQVAYPLDQATQQQPALQGSQPQTDSANTDTTGPPWTGTGSHKAQRPRNARETSQTFLWRSAVVALPCWLWRVAAEVPQVPTTTLCVHFIHCTCPPAYRRTSAIKLTRLVIECYNDLRRVAQPPKLTSKRHPVATIPISKSSPQMTCS